MESGTQMTLEQWMPEACQSATVGALEHPARISQSQEKEQGLTETDHPSLEKYLESCGKSQKRIDPNGLSTRTLKVCLARMGGADYLAIVTEMDELGYDIEWQNFNSKYYVPQNRERIYTIGHLRVKGTSKILPIMPTDGEDSICKVEQIGRQPSANRDNPNAGRVYAAKGISPALNTMEGGGREPHVAVPVSVSRAEGIGGGY